MGLLNKSAVDFVTVDTYKGSFFITHLVHCRNLGTENIGHFASSQFRNKENIRFFIVLSIYSDTRYLTESEEWIFLHKTNGRRITSQDKCIDRVAILICDIFRGICQENINVLAELAIILDTVRRPMRQGVARIVTPDISDTYDLMSANHSVGEPLRSRQRRGYAQSIAN